MRERGIVNQKNGEIWSFVLRHIHSDEAVLILQPPEEFQMSDFPPVFEASEVRSFLNDANEP
jgi:hypothetical protein